MDEMNDLENVLQGALAWAVSAPAFGDDEAARFRYRLSAIAEALAELAGEPLVRLQSTEATGSRDHAVAYVQHLLEQRTTPHPETSAKRLAHTIVTVALSALGADLRTALGVARETP